MVTREDRGARTVPASPRQLARARAAGDQPFSTAFGGACVLAAGGLALVASAVGIAAALRARLAGWIELAGSETLDAARLSEELKGAGWLVLELAAPILVAVCIAALAAGFARAGFRLVPPRFGAGLVPLRRLGSGAAVRGPRAVATFGLSLAAAGSAGWMAGRAVLDHLRSGSPRTALGPLAHDLSRIGLLLLAALFAVGCLDLLFARRAFERRHRMTRREALEERKRTEGDPLWRDRRRRQHRAELASPAPNLR